MYTHILIYPYSRAHYAYMHICRHYGFLSGADAVWPIYLCAYTHIPIYVYTHIRVCAHYAYMHICRHYGLLSYTYIRIYVYTHIRVCIYAYMQALWITLIYVYTHIRIYSYTCMHTCIYAGTMDYSLERTRSGQFMCNRCRSIIVRKVCSAFKNMIKIQ